VRIITTQDDIGGVAVDVDANGALLLRQLDGTLTTILHGDCFLQEPTAKRSRRAQTPENPKSEYQNSKPI